MNTNENTSIITCAECGCVIEGEVHYNDYGSPVCEDCVDSGRIRCDKCGQYCDPDDMIEYDGHAYCEDCRDDLGLVQCDECGEWYKSGDLHQVNGSWRNPDLYLCDGCLEDALENETVFYCDDCEEYYRSRVYDSYVTYDGRTICEGCRQEYYYCEDCGEIYPESMVVYSDEDDCYYCEDCASNHPSSCVHDYGFRPRPVFHGVSGAPVYGDPITIGFELEVDEGDDERNCAAEIMDYFDEDTLYLKHDSSVTFEIVTHPHTLLAYLEDFNLEKLCAIPSRYGFSSHNCGTCGLHMHVGRTQLGESNYDRERVISRIVLLMYRHWDSLVKFSRRREDQLSHWAQAPRLEFLKHIRYTDDELNQLVQNYYACIGRYQALNLCNRGTIEFRLWRGTLKPDTVKATLQLTSNIVTYCMTHTFEDVTKSKWEDIIQQESFPELAAYVAERGIDGLEVRDIPYNNDVPTVPVDDSAVLGYKNGDPVIIISGSSLTSDSMVGATGTVIGHGTTAFGYNRLLLEIDEFSDERYLRRTHDANGRCASGRGYWVYAEDIQLSDPDARQNAGFRVGDRVRMTDSREAPYMRTGTVIIANSYDDLGVRFDDFHSGHSLGRDDITDSSGWWCYAGQLRRTA